MTLGQLVLVLESWKSYLFEFKPLPPRSDVPLMAAYKKPLDTALTRFSYPPTSIPFIEKPLPLNQVSKSATAHVSE